MREPLIRCSVLMLTSRDFVLCKNLHICTFIMCVGGDVYMVSVCVCMCVCLWMCGCLYVAGIPPMVYNRLSNCYSTSSVPFSVFGG